jgi:hypothetical protein
VAKIFFVAFLLHDAFICMNGSQTSNYFLCKAPKIDDWTKTGPAFRSCSLYYYDGPTDDSSGDDSDNAD